MWGVKCTLYFISIILALILFVDKTQGHGPTISKWGANKTFTYMAKRER